MEIASTPILVHCKSGKDRTGILIAALLVLLGLSDDEIIGDYMLSEGILQKKKLQTALKQLRETSQWCDGLDKDKIKQKMRAVNTLVQDEDTVDYGVDDEYRNINNI